MFTLVVLFRSVSRFFYLFYYLSLVDRKGLPPGSDKPHITTSGRKRYSSVSRSSSLDFSLVVSRHRELVR